MQSGQRVRGRHDIADTNGLQKITQYGFRGFLPSRVDFQRLSNTILIAQADRTKPLRDALVGLPQRRLLDRVERSIFRLCGLQQCAALFDKLAKLCILLAQSLNLVGCLLEVPLKLVARLPLPQLLHRKFLEFIL